jgi:hypothetical protein
MPTIGIAGLDFTEPRTSSRLSAGTPSATLPFLLSCRSCGFEPDHAMAAPLRCPKCSGSSWEWLVIPGSLLKRADELADPRSRSRRRRPDVVRIKDNGRCDVHGSDIV